MNNTPNRIVGSFIQEISSSLHIGLMLSQILLEKLQPKKMWLILSLTLLHKGHKVLETLNHLDILSVVLSLPLIAIQRIKACRGIHCENQKLMPNDFRAVNS